MRLGSALRGMTVVGLVLCPMMTVAQGVPERFGRAFDVLDGRASTQYQFSARLRPDAENRDGIPTYVGGYSGPWLEVARAAARRHGIPEDLYLRLVHQESGWNPEAISRAGAIGLAQLMPDTASRMGVDPTDPSANLDAGARYLAQQYRDFGRWDHALAAYNAGPAAVRSHDGIPPYAETQDYVRIILGTG